MITRNRIPLVDLQEQYFRLRKDIDAGISRVIENGSFILGKEVEAFEAAFAAYCESPFCVGVSSGTDSLEQALGAMGVGNEDEVITVAHTFIATVEAVYAVGARPRFVDVDPGTLLMDVAQIESVITPRTKAIIPVHLYGQMVDMDAVVAVASKHGLKVLEDCAQAHGARYNGKIAGSVGDIGSFSFYPGKNLGAYGDAGGLVCRDENLALHMKKGRNHGRMGKYEHDFIGRNARMDGIQGAILATKLPHLDSWNQRRREIANRYDAALASVSGVHLLTVHPDAVPVYHLYVIRVQNRDVVLTHLKECGIEVGVHYPVPLHLQPACADLGYRPGQFPVTEAAAKEILSLPIWPEMEDSVVDTVVAAFMDAVSAAS